MNSPKFTEAQLEQLRKVFMSKVKRVRLGDFVIDLEDLEESRRNPKQIKPNKSARSVLGK